MALFVAMSLAASVPYPRPCRKCDWANPKCNKGEECRYSGTGPNVVRGYFCYKAQAPGQPCGQESCTFCPSPSFCNYKGVCSLLPSPKPSPKPETCRECDLQNPVCRKGEECRYSGTGPNIPRGYFCYKENAFGQPCGHKSCAFCHSPLQCNSRGFCDRLVTIWPQTRRQSPVSGDTK